MSLSGADTIIVEDLPYATIVLDAQSRILHWNRAAMLLYGWSRNEVMGRKASDIIPILRYVDSATAAVVDEALHEHGQWTGSVIQPHRDKQELLITTTIQRVDPGPDPAAPAFIHVNRIRSDDTCGAHTKNASEELYRVLFKHSPDAIWLIDPYSPEDTWPIVDCNEAACRMHGYTREELLGQSIDMFDPAPSPGDKYRPHIDELWQEGHVQATDVHRRKDGSLIHIEYSTTLVTLDGRELMLGVDRDVTARTRAEREVLQAKVQAEHASRVKSEFLSQMSHEFRTPLTTILGYGQLLHSEVPDPHHHAYAGHIIDAGDHLLDMVDGVLDMSRAEAGSLPVVLQTVRLGPVISAAIELVRLEIAAHALHLDTAAVDNDVEVLADPQRLTQVLVNLLDNAAKYNRRGGMISVQCQLTPRFVRVAVQDTGPGIPDDQLRRLFSPFERLGAEQRGIDGVGLGLAFSKHLIEMMHGSIGVQSRVGAGSTFWFELPRAAS